ncbi:MAG: BrnT family toxin [Bryobacteraceae bacterium]
MRKARASTFVIEGLFTRPLAILPDAAHSQQEGRFRAVGRTDKGRGVFIVFTLRPKGDELLIRPISARHMHKKEIEAYEKEKSRPLRATMHRPHSLTRPILRTTTFQVRG